MHNMMGTGHEFLCIFKKGGFGQKETKQKDDGQKKSRAVMTLLYVEIPLSETNKEVERIRNQGVALDLKLLAKN